MRIGILVLMAGRNAGGPETYEVELIRALLRIDRKNEYFIYCTTSKAREAIAVEQPNISWRLLQPSARVVSIAVSFPWLALRDRLDMYHATFTPAPISTRPFVFTMHCISSLVHPEFYKPATAFRLNMLLKRGMAKASHILCVSRTTMQHLEERYHVPPERMSVAYNGVTPGFCLVAPQAARERVTQMIGIDSPYFLFVGKLQAHKNIVRLIEAFAVFRKETRSQAKLVIAGRPTGNAVNPRAVARQLGLENEVVQAGYVPHCDLPALYSAARAFVFPSLWEGFGIPLLEAMSCGVPVISSNSTCLPEIAGGAARLFDPYSVQELAEALTEIDSSERERQRLIQLGFARTQEFTWDGCAAATLKSYEDVHRVKSH